MKHITESSYAMQETSMTRNQSKKFIVRINDDANWSVKLVIAIFE